MQPGWCYVLRGCCSYTFDHRVELRESQFADLPGGNYEFEVIGDAPTDLVLVWELPAEFRPM